MGKLEAGRPDRGTTACDEDDIITHNFVLTGASHACRRPRRLGAWGRTEVLGGWVRRANTNCTGQSGRPSSLYSAVQRSIPVLCRIIMGASRATLKKMSALAPSLAASTCQATSGSRSTLAAGLPLPNKSHDAEQRRPCLVTNQLSLGWHDGCFYLSRNLLLHLRSQASVSWSPRGWKSWGVGVCLI